MANNFGSIDKNLIEKYDIPSFDYIEYPHKSFWSTDVGDADFRKTLLKYKDSANQTALYIHIPFCTQMCYFCLCHKEITSDYSKVRAYLDTLFLEIENLHGFLKDNSMNINAKEIYIGGGSPTIIKEAEFDLLLEKIGLIADFSNVYQLTVEIDPRKTTAEMLKYYYSKGVNKISIGIQDFDPEVQKSVNRIQPPEIVEALLVPSVRKYFKSINFDILVGLPKQTVSTISNTMHRVMKMSPDRISFTYLNYSPKNYTHQALMLKDAVLPDMIERRRLFDAGLKIILNNGYVRNGYEHFSKPADDVAKAREENKAKYSSLGVTQGNCTEMFGLGRHSYSGIFDYYFQHFYEQTMFEKSVREGSFPVYRGYHMDKDDILRREIIQSLRTNFEIDTKDIADRFNINFAEYFSVELLELEPLAADGLVGLSGGKIVVTEVGRPFTLRVCQTFDKYIRQQKQK